MNQPQYGNKNRIRILNITSQAFYLVTHVIQKLNT